jgi:radical SAM protein with 4Fe4S-binding SPASM domain
MEARDKGRRLASTYHLSAPEMVSWEVTNKCNLHCRHCNTSAVAGRCGPEELTTTEMLRVVDELANMSVARLALEGGEPLLREDLIEIIVHAADQCLDTWVLTNGVLLTAADLKVLKTTGTVVQVSLDGPEEVHDEIRGKRGTFGAAVAGIEQCLALGIDVRVNAVASAINWPTVQEVVDLGLTLGLREVRIAPYCPTRPDDPLRLLPEQFSAMRRLIGELRNAVGDRIALRPFSPKFDIFDTNLPSLFTPGAMLCEAGTILCSIMADGTVLPCTHLAESAFHCGNVRDHGLAEIWQRSPALSGFRPVAATLPSICAGCNIAQTCRGGCRARGYRQEGRMDADDPCCPRLYERGGRGELSVCTV